GSGSKLARSCAHQRNNRQNIRSLRETGNNGDATGEIELALSASPLSRLLRRVGAPTASTGDSIRGRSFDEAARSSARGRTEGHSKCRSYPRLRFFSLSPPGGEGWGEASSRTLGPTPLSAFRIGRSLIP